MKIEDKRKNYTSFKDVPPGDVFLYEHNYYIKIVEEGSHVTRHSAMHLPTGRHYSANYFCASVEVLNAKLIIE